MSTLKKGRGKREDVILEVLESFYVDKISEDLRMVTVSRTGYQPKVIYKQKYWLFRYIRDTGRFKRRVEITQK